MEQDITIIPELQEDIRLGDALKRLRKNKDFKLLIQEAFLDVGVKYLTTNITAVRDKEAVYEQLTARSYLYRYLNELEQKAMNASIAMEEILAEEEE